MHLYKFNATCEYKRVPKEIAHKLLKRFFKNYQIIASSPYYWYILSNKLINNDVTEYKTTLKPYDTDYVVYIEWHFIGSEITLENSKGKNIYE